MMKNTLRILLIICFSLSAQAAVGSTKIGTVDMQKALQSVNAGKSARSSLEKDFNKKRESLKKEELAIKKMQEEFQKQSLVMSDKARMKKQQELQERVMKFQESLQRSQMEIQKKEASLTAPILDKMKTIIQSLAKKKGYTVVLEKNENAVLYSQDQDDLTAEVIKQYNSKHKG